MVVWISVFSFCQVFLIFDIFELIKTPQEGLDPTPLQPTTQLFHHPNPSTTQRYYLLFLFLSRVFLLSPLPAPYILPLQSLLPSSPLFEGSDSLSRFALDFWKNFIILLVLIIKAIKKRRAPLALLFVCVVFYRNLFTAHPSTDSIIFACFESQHI